MKITSKLLIASMAIFAACQKENAIKQTPLTANTEISEATIQESGDNPDETILNTDSKSTGGYIYIQSNDAAQNAVVMYKQMPNGQLTWGSSTNSGGKGTGAGLGSQGAIAINQDHTWLFAVNAGSNSVSSFKIKNNGSLELKYTISSGGILPVSVSAYDNLVYVVNSGSSGICGFTIGSDGELTKIQGSGKNLSTTVAGPAQIAFSPAGKTVLVTEKATNTIAAFSLDENGAVADVNFTNSVGQTPFGFDLARDNYMIVSNAAGGAANGSSCTSYKNLDGGITDVNGSVVNHQSAACWVATSKYGRFAYVANAASNSINTYFINAQGAIFNIPWAVAETGAGPIDLIVSGNDLFVYNINSKDHTISAFKRLPLGTLQPIGTITSIPLSAAGIAAY